MGHLDGCWRASRNWPGRFHTISRSSTSALRKSHSVLCKTQTESRLEHRRGNTELTERDLRPGVHLRERGLPAAADVGAAAAVSLETCGSNVFWHFDHGQSVPYFLTTHNPQEVAISN